MIVNEALQGKQFRSSVDVAETFRSILKIEDEVHQDREHFWSMGLDSKNRIKYIELVSLGSLTSSLVHPRETLRLGVLKGVASIILVHNHPSGDTAPSRDDIEITQRLKQAGDILGIKILDHIIIGNNTNNTFSFVDQKML